MTYPINLSVCVLRMRISKIIVFLKKALLKALFVDCIFQFILSLLDVYTKVVITDPISLFHSPPGHFFSCGSSTVTKVNPQRSLLPINCSHGSIDLLPLMNNFMFLPVLLNSVKVLIKVSCLLQSVTEIFFLNQRTYYRSKIHN